MLLSNSNFGLDYLMGCTSEHFGIQKASFTLNLWNSFGIALSQMQYDLLFKILIDAVSDLVSASCKCEFSMLVVA